MIPLSAGPKPTERELRQAQSRDLLLRSELERVRSAALAWRNGLAGLLAAVVGFSLVKGRSDITELSEPAAVTVGSLLLAALVVGTPAALCLLRAAHGRPGVARLERGHQVFLGDHREALAATAALRRGIVLFLLCGALLVGAVATTWYGPARAKPAEVSHVAR